MGEGGREEEGGREGGREKGRGGRDGGRERERREGGGGGKAWHDCKKGAGTRQAGGDSDPEPAGPQLCSPRSRLQVAGPAPHPVNGRAREGGVWGGACGVSNGWGAGLGWAGPQKHGGGAVKGAAGGRLGDAPA